MNLGDLLVADGVMPLLRAKDKKTALLELSQRAAEVTQVDARLIHDALVQRENLGSTGLGRGIAIPHVKLRQLKSISCLFARLEAPIPFDSLDNEPVEGLLSDQAVGFEDGLEATAGYRVLMTGGQPGAHQLEHRLLHRRRRHDAVVG